MRETGRNGYRAKLVRDIKDLWPDAIILANNPSMKQGIPDILVLFGPTWVFIETKASAKAPLRPNQEYYIRLGQEMSYAFLAYPENHEETIHGLQQAFGDRRNA